MSFPGGGGLPQGLLHDTTLVDLDATWSEREEEAAVLIAGGFRTMAVSLRIYALEIRVKATICRRLNLDFLPKVCKTHDLAELLIFTGLWQAMNDPNNDAVRQNWNLLADFSKKRLNDTR